jgi:hypothetical protein
VKSFRRYIEKLAPGDRVRWREMEEWAKAHCPALVNGLIPMTVRGTAFASIAWWFGHVRFVP